MTSDRIPQGQIEVCTDCLMSAVNGDVDPQADPAPWALDVEIDVTPGVMRHADDCHRKTGAAHCYCDESHFSWTPCQGCGSTLGGDRHPMVWWA